MYKLQKTIVIGILMGLMLSNITVYAVYTSSVLDAPHTTEDEIQVHTPTLTNKHIPYMLGNSKGHFFPNETLTRGQAAQLVYRLLENQTQGILPCSYQDITETDWYYNSVTVLCSLGLVDDGVTFRPKEPITRAEFLDLLTKFVPANQVNSSFTDVPASYWAAEQIATAVALGWIHGYEDGKFYPDAFLTRAEACTIMNHMTGRTGDADLARWLLDMQLYADVTTKMWAWNDIVEASLEHTPSFHNATEQWTIDLSKCSFSSGFHEVNGTLYYVYTNGKLAQNTAIGAYWAEESGNLVQQATGYRMQNVPYISQIDGLQAWVGCEPISALMGLKANKLCGDITAKTFLDKLPLTATNPAKGFVGSPYIPDPTKKTRTTIYPDVLAKYCNLYAGGLSICSDFSGSDIQELQRELLAGNSVVAYMTMRWEKPFYRKFNIEGETQWLVSNNHAVLVCGYDSSKGYFISDPYNDVKKNHVYQYWIDEGTFNNIWNERKVGMLLR